MLHAFCSLVLLLLLYITLLMMTALLLLQRKWQITIYTHTLCSTWSGTLCVYEYYYCVMIPGNTIPFTLAFCDNDDDISIITYFILTLCIILLHIITIVIIVLCIWYCYYTAYWRYCVLIVWLRCYYALLLHTRNAIVNALLLPYALLLMQ